MGACLDASICNVGTLRAAFSPLLRGGRGVLESAHVDKVNVFSHTHTSVVQSTELPSLSTDRHLVYPLKASFAPLKRGEKKTPIN